MKRIGLAVSGFLVFAFMFSCSSAALVTPQLKREWMLVSFKNYSKEDLIRHQAKISLTSPAKGRKIKGGAFMGCNKMFFMAAFKKDGTANFSDIGSTMVDCQDMKLEDDFSRSFEKMKLYHLEGHFLILDDNQGNSMKFIAADWD